MLSYSSVYSPMLRDLMRFIYQAVKLELSRSLYFTYFIGALKSFFEIPMKMMSTGSLKPQRTAPTTPCFTLPFSPA
jgi:hypothetical protein